MSRSIPIAEAEAAAPARQPLAVERVVTLFAAFALAASMVVPLSAFGATRNWSLSRTPANVTGGAPASVQVTAANIGDDGGGEAVGCVIIAIPASAFMVSGVVIDSVSDGDAWSASLSGDSTWWYVRLFSNSGGANRLHGIPSESVTATVTFTDTGLDGTFTWTGNAFNKEDCTDDFLMPRLVSVTIDGATPNTAPVAAPDLFATSRNVPLTVTPAGVLGNDSDADGDPLSAALVAGPSNGALAWTGDGAFTYTPAPGFVGADAFVYRADDGVLQSADTTVSISVVNGAPVALDDSYSTAWGQLLTVPAPGFMGNDTDPDGDPLTASIVSLPNRGVLVANADGSFTYLPGPLFVGADAFVYQVTDGLSSAQATVTINVGNTAPVATPDGPYNATEDSTLSVAAPGVLANDSDADGDPLSAVLVAGASNGSVTLAANGAFDYVPLADYFGPDSFTYRASDGVATSGPVTVTIDVVPVADPPTAAPDAVALSEDTPLTVPAPGVLSNDTDPDGDALVATVATGPAHGTLALAPDGGFVYVPDSNWYGIDTFTYSAGDGTASSTTTATLSVASVNDAPVAAADLASTPHATAVLVDVLVNDIDVDGDPLVISALGAPSVGSATIVANRVRFVPPAGYAGPATIGYTASDGFTTDSAILTITVDPAPPVLPTPPPPDPSPSPRASAPPASPDPTPTPAVAVPSDPLPTTSPSPSVASPRPTPPTVASPPPSGGSGDDPLDPLTRPEIMTGSFGNGAAPFDGVFSSFGSTFGWAVPAALLGVPGLLFILAVSGQLLGAAAWIPAVRRQLAGVGVRRRGHDRSQALLNKRYP